MVPPFKGSSLFPFLSAGNEVSFSASRMIEKMGRACDGREDSWFTSGGTRFFTNHTLSTFEFHSCHQTNFFKRMLRLEKKRLIPARPEKEKTKKEEAWPGRLKPERQAESLVRVAQEGFNLSHLPTGSLFFKGTVVTCLKIRLDVTFFYFCQTKFKR